MPAQDLLQPLVTDTVRDRGTAERYRVFAFYRLDRLAPSTLPGITGPSLALTECAAHDPDMSVIGTVSSCSRFFRPWDLVWESASPWPRALVDQEIRVHRDNIANPRRDRLHDRDYPGLFGSLSPLSQHDRVRLMTWRRETHESIRAADPAPHPARLSPTRAPA